MNDGDLFTQSNSKHRSVLFQYELLSSDCPEGMCSRKCSPAYVRLNPFPASKTGAVLRIARVITSIFRIRTWGKRVLIRYQLRL